MRRIFTLLWQSCAWWALLSTSLMLVEVVSGLAVLYLVKRLIDVLAETSGPDPTHLSHTLFYITLTGGTTLLHLTAKSLAALAYENQGERVADYVDGLIHEKAIEADLAFYESPHYFDTLHRARQAGPMRPAGVVANLLQLSRNAIMLLAIGGLIVSIQWLLLPVLLLGVVPGVLVRLHFTQVLYQWQKRRTQLQRRAAYIDWLITSDHHAKELRLNHLGSYLKNSLQALRELIRREKLKISQKRTLIELTMSLAGTLAFFLSLVYLGWRATRGETSVGDLVLFLLVFQRGQATVQALLGNISKLYEDHLYIGHLFEFLDVQPSLIEPPQPRPVPLSMRQGLMINDITFRYPGTQHVALKQVSLQIEPGQVVALVGANGSGKTTLIKLLCRLYDPTCGTITLDNIDVRKFSKEDYRQVFSVIFQDYAKYALTVRDNIRFGDISLPEDSPEISKVAGVSGADSFIQQLPYGYDTQLSRVFDEGAELSIGQWQKVALARAFLRQSQVVVLDEPTSALDANAEFELFHNFRQHLGHRAALVISHRLSTVRQADYIYVLDRGRIVEEGTHDMLMSYQDGRYQHMFECQAYHYRETLPPEDLIVTKDT